MTEYLDVVKKENIIKDFMPNVEKILLKAVDPTTADEIRVQVAKLSGKVLD